MRADLDLFASLARSIDRHVESSVRHYVVVPSADVKAFRSLATRQREIIAQEDVLPTKLWKLPSALRHLTFLREGFRRPLYITSGRHLVRGWMLQQLLKIEMARRCTEDAVMHIDSDVAFFRSLHHSDAFTGEKVKYFRACGKTRNPMHRPWVENSCRLLGVKAPEEHNAHYIENCVLWSRDVTRRMVGRIEEVNSAPLHDVIFRQTTLSEYYLYGIYADMISQGECLSEEAISFCNSFWPDTNRGTVDFEDLRARLQPKHRAIAVQSTYKLSLPERLSIYERAERELA